MFPFEEFAAQAIFNYVALSSFLNVTVFFLGQILPWITGVWFLISLFCVQSFKIKFYYAALAIISVVVSRGIITETVHNFFVFYRPFEALEISPIIYSSVGEGLISGHMAFFIPLVLIFISFKKKEGGVFGLFVLLIAIGRIAAGTIWISAVLTGLLTGIAGFTIAKILLPKYLVKTRLLPKKEE